MEAGQAIIAEFVEPGVARLVYRQFPVVGPFSLYRAEVSECAADQNRFWAFHDAAFQRARARALRRSEDAEAVAREVGLDVEALKACQRDGRVRGRIEADAAEGQRRGVEATPTLFVGDRKIVGNQPIDVFRDAVNAVKPR
jgi:protein-disulfide isomerase